MEKTLKVGHAKPVMLLGQRRGGCLEVLAVKNGEKGA